MWASLEASPACAPKNAASYFLAADVDTLDGSTLASAQQRGLIDVVRECTSRIAVEGDAASHMSWVSLLAAGVWPAVPLTGYMLLSRTAPDCLRTHPVIVSMALISVAGCAVWSALLLGAAAAGAYRPDLLGLVGWVISGAILATILVARAKVATPARSGVVAEAPVPASTEGSNTPAGTPPSRGSKKARRAPRRDQSTRALAGSTWITRRAWAWVLGVGLVTAAALYLGFPGECVYAQRDEGVYANHAIHLARHGRLDVPYPFPAEMRSIFFDVWVGYPGFYNTPGSMTAQFGHLFPVWLAQAFASFGAHGLFRLNAVFAALSLCVFYGVCRAMMPQPYAVGATLFLAFNPSQLWIARITLSEVPTQLLIWSGLLLLVEALKGRNRSTARWAGIVLGLSAFMRFDAFVLVPLLLLSHAAFALTREPVDAADRRSAATAVWWALYQAALPIYALALGYYAVFSGPYFEEVSWWYVTQIAGGTVAALLVLLVASTPLARRLRPWLAHDVVLGVLSAAVVAVTMYAAWIRPGLSNHAQQLVQQWPGYVMDKLRDYGQDSLVNLAQYLSPPLVCVAIAGWLGALWLIARSSVNRHFLPVLVVVGGCAVLHLWRSSTLPDHFWAVRRFVPVVIPGFVLCAALGVRALLERLPKPWPTVVAALAVIYLSAFTVRADDLIITFSENAGLFGRYKELAEKLPRDEPIIVAGYPTWSTLAYMGFDREVIPIDFKHPKGVAAWDAWLDQRVRAGKPVYFVTSEGVGMDRLTGRKSQQLFELLLSRRFTEPTVTPLPRTIVLRKERVQLHRIDG